MSFFYPEEISKTKMKKIKKKIIFFDGDGTLWYPQKTKYRKKPHWVYSLEGTHADLCEHLMMIPTVLDTLKKLKKLQIITILISTHPHKPKEAGAIIRHKMSYFKLDHLFDEIHATREFHASKGEFIVKILKKRSLAKNKALMVGDSYNWDYKPARDVGVDALLIESEYMKKDRRGKKIKKTIKKLSDVLKYV
jgi:FMN phosphatase YigB (HAD superfamily)